MLASIINHKTGKDNNEFGFTLIELLVVILIIGVLAAIAIPAFLNQRERANEASAKSDLRQMQQAFIIAKADTGRTALQITGYQYTSNHCATSTNPENLPKTHDCWTNYNRTLQRISDASGIDITGLVDPYGRPYFIDENEGENGNCGKDMIGFFKYPIPSGTGGYAAKTSYSIALDNVSNDCLSR